MTTDQIQKRIQQSYEHKRELKKTEKSLSTEHLKNKVLSLVPFKQKKRANEIAVKHQAHEDLKVGVLAAETRLDHIESMRKIERYDALLVSYLDLLNSNRARILNRNAWFIRMQLGDSVNLLRRLPINFKQRKPHGVISNIDPLFFQGLFGLQVFVYPDFILTLKNDTVKVFPWENVRFDFHTKNKM